MGKKNKLTSPQKRRLKTLQSYLEKNDCWYSDQSLKELAQDDGRYVILMVRSPIFDHAVACDTREEIDAIRKYAPFSNARILDLDAEKERDRVFAEDEKGWIPRLRKWT